MTTFGPMTTLLLAQSTTAPAASDDPQFADLFLRMLLILGGLLVASVLLLKFGLPLLMRRRFRAGTGLIEVVEAHPLEARKTIYLLRVDRQYYLVGSCDGQLTTLAGEPLDNDAIADAVAPHQPSASSRVEVTE